MAGIRKIGLITNIKQSSDGEARVRKVAATIHADVYYQPRTAGERKPSPLLLKRAFKELGVKSHEAAFIGDKYVDVLAGSRAHVGRIAWVKRLGTTDHLADRLLYRPIEPLLKWLI
jgi:predicted HAD superfamily phosphohydrolase YqeG